MSRHWIEPRDQLRGVESMNHKPTRGNVMRVWSWKSSELDGAVNRT